MRQNLVPTYRLSLPVGTSRGFERVARKFRRVANAVMSLVQGLGSAADKAMISALRWLGKHTVGRELDVIEAGKLLLFLHKVVIVAFIAGYVVGYMVR